MARESKFGSKYPVKVKSKQLVSGITGPTHSKSYLFFFVLESKTPRFFNIFVFLWRENKSEPKTAKNITLLPGQICNK